ncbi:DUF6338 family protein [Tindallia californiensis]|uniref:Uncharacterized protein n=1 Tax=Tindallia californiensis TaxID=159292 RepID=A0A1H3R247_9FIRM|nr:DUF6338 family protein [Tindallia californiensis]SDZ19019.1 hypothetical protein SAMN05192546_11160 [Tindallia californiensis]
MDISNIIALLIFILPGLLSESVSSALGCPKKDSPSEIRLAVKGIMISIPIIVASSIIYASINKLWSINLLVESLNQISNLAIYLMIVFVLSVIAGVLSEPAYSLWMKLIAYIRKQRNLIESSNKSCWEKFLIDRKESRFLEVILPDGKSEKGFAYCYSTPNEEKSLILGIDEVLFEFEDFDVERLFHNVKETYIDIEKNVVIKDYDMSDYIDWQESKSE